MPIVESIDGFGPKYVLRPKPGLEEQAVLRSASVRRWSLSEAPQKRKIYA